MTDSVLTVDGLTVDFGPTPAVRGVGFRIDPGEVVALVGESGSGKSVTARAVLGLLPGTATVRGSARLGERELIGAPEPTLRQVRGREVSMVFQDPATALNPVFTIGRQLRTTLRAHRRLTRAQADAEAVRLLDLVGIPDPAARTRHYPHQLSGGQRQRVVIAIALANDPRLIIADEPTTALDVTVQAEILALLRDLRDRLGTAILLITHNMGVVAELADRVVVLRDGLVEEDAPVHRLFSAPARPYTRLLLDSVPRLGHRPPATPVTTDTDALRLTDLVVTYPGGRGRPDFRAVDGVTLRVGRGEVVGLVGESGSGKSTIGRVAAGLLRPTSGSARLLDEPLEKLSRRDLRAARARLGFAFQDPGSSLDPLLTVAECIAEPLRIHGVDGATHRIPELLDAVRLPATHATRKPTELSGGQRQRVGLARALALHPDLLVADEPTSALDVSVQAAILELLADLQRDLGFACLFISHDLAVVDSLAHRVVVLRAGKVEEEGPHDEVLRNPRADYTRRLVAAVPVPTPPLTAASTH
ncbi:dipeptide ABC transporter ATP-binding protein [Actinokineospora spheciospongiae]|uniref:dipeptide ABC transporter ATP-binding protein n=1 Tax=Actinokineospora spheciospongiae TaxID=909613 RepID=UPI000D7120CB|nr:ABC transporter ATP-binding protein [Actinokineospora spheciospongiae]PWW66899.1 peptide/nickel transport system ATP-binding protein [Actinokineospora spheciospongiae]